MKNFGLILLLAGAVTLGACVTRMAPFAPHRTNSPEHRAAKSNTDCLGCHDLAKIGQGHQPSDDCLRCHRIVQGD